MNVIDLQILTTVLRQFGIPAQFTYFEEKSKTRCIIIPYRGMLIYISFNSVINNELILSTQNVFKTSQVETKSLILRDTDTELFIIEQLQRALYRMYCKIDKFEV